MGKGISLSEEQTRVIAGGAVAVAVLVLAALAVWSGFTWLRPKGRFAVDSGVALRVQPVKSGSGIASPPGDSSPDRPDAAGPAKARTDPSAPLAIASTAVNLSGTGAGEAFGLLVLKSGGPIDRLEYSCSPLRPEGDASPRPAPEVSAQPEANGLPPEAQRDILLKFVLPPLPAGKFSCRLFVRDQAAAGTGTSVPVTLAVKHDWPWPLFVLILGVVAGAVVSNYRTVGRPRDEAYQRLGRLRSEMNADDRLAPEFRDHIEQTFLAEAEMYVRNGQWGQAAPRLDGAQEAWFRWLRYRDQWIELLDYVAEYEKTVAGMSARARTTRTCRDELDALRHGVATIDKPDPLRARLAGVRDRLQTYRDLGDDLKEAEAIGDHLPPDQQDQWEADIRGLREKLDALDVGNDSDVRDLKKSIEDMESKAKPKQALAAARARAPGPSPRIPAVPLARSLQGERQEPGKSPPIELPVWLKAALSPEYAGVRLTVFHWSAWVATMVVLTWTGMEQLYAHKPTFGSGADYFAMVGWGFGSNAASSTIVQAFNGAPTSSPR
jgi:hypothetical protein